MPNVDILFDSPLWAKARLSCRKRVPLILETAWALVPQKPKGFDPEVTVTLSCDADIQILNRDHRGKDKPTNVLSFPDWDCMADIPAGIGAAPIGDIVIAFETIRREAHEQGKSLAHHFSHMITHGFLHLLGYDHIKSSDADEMEALEVKILRKMGVPNPYISS